MSDPTNQVVQTLGKRYLALRKRLSDLQVLTSPEAGEAVLAEMADIRNSLVEAGAAYALGDGSIIIKTDYIIRFIEPNFPQVEFSKSAPPNLRDPEVVEKIALTCGLTQWVFLANQIPDADERAKFLKTCAAIVAERAKRRP